jgi:hypothetical protein
MFSAADESFKRLLLLLLPLLLLFLLLPFASPQGEPSSIDLVGDVFQELLFILLSSSSHPPSEPPKSIIALGDKGLWSLVSSSPDRELPNDSGTCSLYLFFLPRLRSRPRDLLDLL